MPNGFQKRQCLISQACHIFENLFMNPVEGPTRLYLGPARISTFVSAIIQISVSHFIPIKQPSALVVSPVLDCTPTSTCRHNTRPSHPPPWLSVQNDSRRPRPSEAGTELTMWALSVPRGGRGLAIRPDTRPIRSV